MTIRHAFVKQIRGISFAGKTDSNHWVAMDGPEEFGGSNAGTRPKELVLVALAGCTSSDVVSILQKKRVALDSYEVHVTAEQRDEHPQVFTSIHLEFVFRGTDIRPADVARAIELSETKYCAVSAMLRGTVALTHSYRIEPAAVASHA
jgi:putative redox protein